MFKAAFVVVTALVVTGSSLAYAQQPSTLAPGQESWRPSAADLNAFTDARIAALKAGLQLTPDQAKNWPAVEQAVRDMAKARQDRMAARHNDQHRGDAIEFLRDRADAMTLRAAELKKLADAAQPLYETLSPDQKHRLRFLVRMLRPDREHFAERHEHRGHEGAQQ
jgi:zinc resistance-associated protein